jgi:hypothetical protein
MIERRETKGRNRLKLIGNRILGKKFRIEKTKHPKDVLTHIIRENVIRRESLAQRESRANRGVY